MSKNTFSIRNETQYRRNKFTVGGLSVNKLLFLVMVTVLSSTIISCGTDSKTEDPVPIVTGGGDNTNNTGNAELAPDFTLVDIMGNSIRLSDYKNKVVVLFFLGYACPSCKAVAPSVQSQLLNPYSSRNDYVVLGLDQWNGNLAGLTGFKTDTQVTFPLLLNASATASAFKTTYDRLVVVDKMGKIRFTGSRLVSSDISSAKTIVDTYLAQ